MSDTGHWHDSASCSSATWLSGGSGELVVAKLDSDERVVDT